MLSKNSQSFVKYRPVWVMPIGGVEHAVNLFHRIQADNQAGDDRVGQTEFYGERDTEKLERIGFPLFSYGVCPSGPLRLDPRDPKALGSAHFGDFQVEEEDVVFADADGVLFAPGQHAEELLSISHQIWETERRQAQAIRADKTLREQLPFDEYLARRSTDPTYTFRKHLRNIGGAIEA